MLNNDCLEKIWKIYYKTHCVENIYNKMCPKCQKIKNECMLYCMKCDMVDVGFTSQFIVLFSALKNLT